MRQKTTSILLAGIVTLFFSLFSMAQPAPQPVKTLPVLTKKDTTNINKIEVDSVETIGNLKFQPFKKKAHASYYADRFNGQKTASGKKFDNKKYTAAHRKFPFGTKLRITNEANGKCVIVEVTDRGPFSRGREIDISKRAFMEITHNKGSGSVDVTIEVVK